jgi:D-alanyl-D-alanine carboxypeptidase/D-alanyl-D-alanine-endopeptidase (penicillin-binding protein 4)
LVLVGSGDLTFGLRQRPNGTLFYNNLPKVDQSYADQLPGAVEPPGNPLSALNQLAKQVKASGITRVNGNVVVDQRLFGLYSSYVVRNRVRTVKRRKATNMNVTEPTPGRLVIGGQIPAGAPPTLRIWEVDHPGAFARTAFIEALRRAGVAVTAPDTGSNPTGLLPARAATAPQIASPSASR